MFTRTKIYSVYVKKGDANPLENPVFLKQGFNLWAFLFTVGWSLYNRLWLVSLALVVVSALLAANDGSAGILATLAFNIWFGFEANNFKSSKLLKKGYILFDVSTGIDKLAAAQRFFDKYLINKPQAVKQGSFSMKPSASL